MSQTDRPVLGLEIECQIEAALNQVHTLYWPRLEQMQEFTSEARDQYRILSSSKIPRIPPPRSPNALKLLLGRYAAALFESEATFYPDGPELTHWLKKLGQRVTSEVLDKVAQVEHAGSFRYVSLTYHNVRLPDMQKAISAAIEEEAIKRMVTVATGRIKESIANAQKAIKKTQESAKESAELLTRRGFVEPILERKGWSILDWANAANVAHATAMDYVLDKTSPYRSTRAKLAKALGVPIEQFPQ